MVEQASLPPLYCQSAPTFPPIKFVVFSHFKRRCLRARCYFTNQLLNSSFTLGVEATFLFHSYRISSSCSVEAKCLSTSQHLRQEARRSPRWLIVAYRPRPYPHRAPIHNPSRIIVFCPPHAICLPSRTSIDPSRATATLPQQILPTDTPPLLRWDQTSTTSKLLLTPTMLSRPIRRRAFEEEQGAAPPTPFLLR